MRIVFGDTFYWVSLANPRDAWHDQVHSLTRSLRPAQFVTTDEILVELLNYYCGFGAQFRADMAAIARRMLRTADIEVVEQTRAGLLRGWNSTRAGWIRGTVSLIAFPCR